MNKVRLTVTTLANLGACELVSFKAVFPNGCYPNLTAAKKAAKARLDWGWLIDACLEERCELKEMDLLFRKYENCPVHLQGSDEDLRTIAAIVRLYLETQT